MPSYNHEEFISTAIESVLNQTFTDFEFIIIDDASKDGSNDIIKAYEEKDSRIRAIFHNENKGIARTMNEGLEEVGGKFIAMFASDDVWVKDKLEMQLEVLKKNEDLVVWSEGLVIDAQGDPTGELFTQRHSASKRKKSGNIFEELLKGNFICGQSVIFKRENLEGIRYDEQLKYLNDYKFMVDLSRKCEYYFIPASLAMYRIHGRNSSISEKESLYKEGIQIRRYFLQKYGNEIQSKTKAHIFHIMSMRYLHFGEKAKARQCVYHAIKLNPVYHTHLLYLIIALTKEDGAIRDILRWGYKRYKGCEKWIQKFQS